MKVIKPALIALMCIHTLCAHAEGADKLFNEPIVPNVPALSVKEGNIYYAMDAALFESLVRNGLDISNLNVQNLLSAELSNTIKSSVVNIGDKQEANNLVVVDGHIKLVNTPYNMMLYVPHVALASK